MSRETGEKEGKWVFIPSFQNQLCQLIPSLNGVVHDASVRGNHLKHGQHWWVNMPALQIYVPVNKFSNEMPESNSDLFAIPPSFSYYVIMVSLQDIHMVQKLHATSVKFSLKWRYTVPHHLSIMFPLTDQATASLPLCSLRFDFIGSTNKVTWKCHGQQRSGKMKVRFIFFILPTPSSFLL